MRTAQVARQAGVNAQTLRYYERADRDCPLLHSLDPTFDEDTRP